MQRASLNHCYRLVWSEVHHAFVAVAEAARARGKRASRAALAAATLAALPVPTFAANLPTGGQIVAGSGAVATSGNTMTVTQNTDKMAANWQSFSIGPGHAVNFVQPSAASIALNRVLGSDVSVIQGALNANGQVFLINPNGVLFSPTAQVNVGSIVTSTLDLTNEAFLAGRYRFTGESAAAIRNEGNFNVRTGGTAAFIAARIENTGSIEAPKGNVLMGAGQAVTLDLGGPAKIQVEKGALQAQIAQGGAIHADGGRVYLTAQAAGDLASAAINHTGQTEARALSANEKGEIVLLGDMQHGHVNLSGTLDASGGFVETSANHVKIADGARVSADHWLIDPQDFTIAASGGDITGATLAASLASGDVTIQSASGATSGNGDIFVRDNVTWSSGRTLTLSAYRNIDILATLDATGGSGGKVALEYGQGAVAADNTASYRFGLTGAGFTGQIKLQAGNNFSTKLGSDGTPTHYTVITSLGDEGSMTGTDLQGMAGNLSGNYALGADIDASATSGWNGGAGFDPIVPFSGRLDGLGHVIHNLTINRPDTNNIGLIGSASSTAFVTNLGLANNNVTGSLWVGGLVGYNFGAIAQSYATGTVTGTGNYVGGLVGYNNAGAITQSHTTGAVSGKDYTGGLIGFNYQGTISLSHATGAVSGTGYVGGLVGIDNHGGSIIRSYATGAVTSIGSYTGGLVGSHDGILSQSYATGAVSGTNCVGGLTGENWGDIIQSYATGNVTGRGFYIGGLAGLNYHGNITQSYATGYISGNDDVGGLVGYNDSGTFNSSFYDSETTGQSDTGKGEGKTTTQMKSLATFAWDIDDQGGTSKAWRLYEGQSYPLLRWGLAPLTVTAASGTRAYDATTNGLGVAYSTTPNANLLGTATASVSSKNAGTYMVSPSGLWSNQQGYDISYVNGTVTVAPKALTITGSSAADKIYDGGTAANVTPGTLSGFVGSETVTASASGSFADKNVGNNKNVAVSYVLANGSNGGLASNYTLASAALQADILPRPLTVTADAKSKMAGQADPLLTYTTGCGALPAPCGLVAGDALSGSLDRVGGAGAGSYAITQGTLGHANYAITYIGANLTVTAPPPAVATPTEETVTEATPQFQAGLATAHITATDLTGTSPTGPITVSALLLGGGGPPETSNHPASLVHASAPPFADIGDARPAGSPTLSGGLVFASGNAANGRDANGFMHIGMAGDGLNFGAVSAAVPRAPATSREANDSDKDETL